MVKEVCVIGAGTMGSGIAHVFLLSGFHVTLIDKSMEILAEAQQKISINMDRQIKKGMITNEQKLMALESLVLSSTLTSINDRFDLIIEAIVENKSTKMNLYKDLIEKIGENTIIATNTSSISITELAPLGREDRFIGMHFMNPVPVMELVEVIKGYLTSQKTLEIINETITKLHKKSIEVIDSPGFISNRILMQMINEAVFCLYEGIASAEGIDNIFKMGMNHPMGPLTLADFIGLDVCLDILNVLYDGFKDNKYRPCPLLVKMVNAKRLGRKTSEGFYKYTT